MMLVVVNGDVDIGYLNIYGSGSCSNSITETYPVGINGKCTRIKPLESVIIDCSAKLVRRYISPDCTGNSFLIPWGCAAITLDTQYISGTFAYGFSCATVPDNSVIEYKQYVGGNCSTVGTVSDYKLLFLDQCSPSFDVDGTLRQSYNLTLGTEVDGVIPYNLDIWYGSNSCGSTGLDAKSIYSGNVSATSRCQTSGTGEAASTIEIVTVSDAGGSGSLMIVNTFLMCVIFVGVFFGSF